MLKDRDKIKSLSRRWLKPSIVIYYIYWKLDEVPRLNRILKEKNRFLKKKISQFDLAVWPAIVNIQIQIYIFLYERRA